MLVFKRKYFTQEVFKEKLYVLNEVGDTKRIIASRTVIFPNVETRKVKREGKIHLNS